MAELETFYERFTRLLREAGLSDTAAASLLGLSAEQVRRVKSGRTESLKLDAALRLCDHLAISPHYLATGRERAPAIKVQFDDVTLGVDVRVLNEAMTAELSASALHEIAAALQRAGLQTGVTKDATLPTTSAEMGSLSPEQQRTLLALGGANLADAVEQLRRRVEALEASRDSHEEPQKRRAAQ